MYHWNELLLTRFNEWFLIVKHAMTTVRIYMCYWMSKANSLSHNHCVYFNSIVNNHGNVYICRNDINLMITINTQTNTFDTENLSNILKPNLKGSSHAGFYVFESLSLAIEVESICILLWYSRITVCLNITLNLNILFNMAILCIWNFVCEINLCIQIYLRIKLNWFGMQNISNGHKV